MECSNGVMELYTKAAGEKINNTVKARSLPNLERLAKVIGSMARERLSNISDPVN